MPALQYDQHICEALFSLEEQLTIQQLRFVAERLRDLLTRYDTAARDERAKPIEWAEWSAFIDAAYSCEFVCRDGGEDMGDREKTPVPEFMRRLEGDLGRVDTLGLRDLCRVLHYIMRSERWSDGGAGTGGGAVRGLITSRLGDAIARRLGV
jgi:hypothetical protein